MIDLHMVHAETGWDLFCSELVLSGHENPALQAGSNGVPSRI
jgi:hypothetical protein